MKILIVSVAYLVSR